MKCFVTGGSGFIGSTLVRDLVSRGHQVRVLLRSQANDRALQGLPIEKVQGDLASRRGLVELIRGCDWCFHVAASYHLWLKDYGPMYQANVEGTRNVLEAAAEADCRKIVYTSTVGCIGLPQKREGQLIPGDESSMPLESQLSNHYKKSKFKAEQIAMDLARKGLPVVVVNPSAPIGPGDLKPTPTGQIIVDYLNRRMPAYVDTGLNWVHVRDVAIGHILAAEKGQIGERYILGNADGNYTLQQTFSLLEEITGIPAPKIRLPYGVAWTVAVINEGLSAITGKAPRAPLGGVRMAKYKMFFNPAKAIRDLGLPQTPVKQALQEAVDWFRKNGYA